MVPEFVFGQTQTTPHKKSRQRKKVAPEKKKSRQR